MKCYWTKLLSYLQKTHCNLPGFPDLAGVSDTAEKGPALWLPSSSVVQWRFAGWTRLGTTRDFSPEPGKRRQKHRLSLTCSTLEDVTAIPSTLYSNTEILLCLSCSSVVASFSLSDSLSLSQRCRSLLSTSRCWRLALVCSSLCSVVWSCLARWLRQARVSRRICFMPLISFLCLERIWECATQSKMKTKSSKKIIVASIKKKKKSDMVKALVNLAMTCDPSHRITSVSVSTWEFIKIPAADSPQRFHSAAAPPCGAAGSPSATCSLSWPRSADAAGCSPGSGDL